MENIDEEEAPLKNLINYGCYSQWRIYGEINEKIKEEVEKIEELCQEKFEKIKTESNLFLKLK